MFRLAIATAELGHERVSPTCMLVFLTGRTKLIE